MSRRSHDVVDGACRLRSAPSAAPGGFQAIGRQLMRDLEDDFGDALTLAVRERIVDEVLQRLRGAIVDNYLPILAARHARARAALELGVAPSELPAPRD